MSAPYKKDFRYIKNSSKYLLETVFSEDPDISAIGANMNFFSGNDKKSIEIYHFLESATPALWRNFGIDVCEQSGSHDAFIYVQQPLQTPHVRTKKRRTRKHAKLVIMAKLSRKYKKLNAEELFAHLTKSFESRSVA